MLTLMKNHYKPKQVVPKALESYYKEKEKEKMLSVTLPQLEKAFKIEQTKFDIQLDVGYETVKKAKIQTQDTHSQQYLDEIDELYIQKFKDISIQCNELDLIPPILHCIEIDFGKELRSDSQFTETLRSIPSSQMINLANKTCKGATNGFAINTKEMLIESIQNPAGSIIQSHFNPKTPKCLNCQNIRPFGD